MKRNWLVNADRTDILAQSQGVDEKDTKKQNMLHIWVTMKALALMVIELRASIQGSELRAVQKSLERVLHLGTTQRHNGEQHLVKRRVKTIF